MSIIRVRNPVAEPVLSQVDPARRVGDLKGKRIGMYWNIKAGGDMALEHAQDLLSSRYPDSTFSFYQGDVGMGTRHCTAALADKIVTEVDAVIGTSAD